MDQETVEQFEDRVLNKRAAKLQFRMRKLFEDTSSLTYNDLARRKDTKKDNAQKFYSLLVLQKFHALDINQSSIYGSGVLYCFVRCSSEIFSCEMCIIGSMDNVTI